MNEAAVGLGYIRGLRRRLYRSVSSTGGWEVALGTVQTFVPTKSVRFLDPDHARIASEAFEAALQSLDGKESTLSPHRLRHLLASFIVERVMHGEIDVNQLALAAVESLDGAEEASA